MKTNIFSAAIGAAIGGYTQFDSNDPSALYTGAGMAVGGFAGSKLDYSTIMHPVNRLKNAYASNVMSSIDTGSVFAQNIQDTQRQYKKKASRYRQEVARLDSKIHSLNRRDPIRKDLVMEKSELMRNRLANINFMLGPNNSFQSMADVDKFVATSISASSSPSDLKRLSAINTGLSFTSELRSLSDVVLPGKVVPKFNPIFTGGEDMQNVLGILESHLGKLGYADPGKEARLFLEAKDIQGMHISVNEQAIHVFDPKLIETIDFQ